MDDRRFPIMAGWVVTDWHHDACLKCLGAAETAVMFAAARGTNQARISTKGGHAARVERTDR